MSTNISHFIGNFNPRSHEGSDQYLERVRSIDSEISIHAPTRGATTTSMGSNYLVNISIHAPTRGATNMGTYLYNLAIISIHAPTRGATCFTHSDFPFLLYFNPRSHEGSDGKHTPDLLSLLFQSTLPRGERHGDFLSFPQNKGISIHAPTRGATIAIY